MFNSSKKDIHYVMAFQHNTVIYTSKGEITCTVSFNKMEKLLSTQFLRFIEAIRLIENIFVCF